MAVMGAGAIGSLMGGLLAEAGNDVVLIGRAAHIEAIRKDGLTITGLVDLRLRNIHASTEIPDETFDLILLAVKAYNVRQAASQIKSTLSSKTRVLYIQNGLNVDSEVAEVLGRNCLLRGVTFCGSILEKPGIITYTAAGDTYVGSPFDGEVAVKAEEVVEILRDAGLSTKVASNIERAVWSKTLVNAGINPYATLLSVRNGELLEIEGMQKIMSDTVKEGVSVAENIGVSLEENTVALMFETVKATAKNVNSMLQDVKAGRKTEIDYLNGAISKIGDKEGMPTPLNSLITTLIKGLSKTMGR
jgi:2-dehydropantoate 2-reductase